MQSEFTALQGAPEQTKIFKLNKYVIFELNMPF